MKKVFITAALTLALALSLGACTTVKTKALNNYPNKDELKLILDSYYKNISATVFAEEPDRRIVTLKGDSLTKPEVFILYMQASAFFLNGDNIAYLRDAEGWEYTSSDFTIEVRIETDKQLYSFVSAYDPGGGFLNGFWQWRATTPDSQTVSIVYSADGSYQISDPEAFEIYG
ncbi:MAG: hypothetical protein LBC56_02075 [Oscillospiraceae bacterium]|jgi:hypothetical protein|nr:hypothetical protein [Oscillospiraceae bacterium]